MYIKTEIEKKEDDSKTRERNVQIANMQIYIRQLFFTINNARQQVITQHAKRCRNSVEWIARTTIGRTEVQSWAQQHSTFKVLQNSGFHEICLVKLQD